MSFARLAQQPPHDQARRLRRVIPQRCFEHLGRVDPQRYGPSGEADAAFMGVVDPLASEAHLRAPAEKHDRDYALSLDLGDAGGGQLELGFIVINDLLAPRFDIDVDEKGNPTLLGTATRNLPEERRALEAGLGPCQVRRGLRIFAELLPNMEALAAELGYVAIHLEPLTYHNAVMYENYGFAYMTGRKRMKAIDAAFAPGGVLRKACDGSTTFRRPQHADTARGRSWAIHDGILTELDGDEALEVKMVKVLGQDAGQRTFLTSGGSSTCGPPPQRRI
jgi:acetoin utilization protein AcuC